MNVPTCHSILRIWNYFVACLEVQCLWLLAMNTSEQWNGKKFPEA